MEFKFDPNLDYQLDAIESVVDVFADHPNTHEDVTFAHGANLAVSNELVHDDEQILADLNDVQERHGIEPSETLRNENDALNFNIEMETGTGKTYVYLRTIHELFEEYGWKKFIILVPSVAIREGVLKTLEQTGSHFEKLYGGHPFNYCEYDSSSLSDVIRFGNSNQIEVMVMTLQSINRGEDNIMFRHQDTLNGDRPVDRLSATNPILLLDEPQNMEGENSRSAIRELDPLFSLRYSATHRTLDNLTYSLTPVDAHEMGLVKQIEVLSVTTDEDFNKTYLKVIDIEADSDGPKAKIELHKNMTSGTKRGKKTVRAGDNLYSASKGVASYEGLFVETIDAGREHVVFSDGTRLSIGDTTDTDIETIQHRQIRETIREHFEKAKELHDQGIKVLSLFFIDRVANFRGKSGEAVGHLWEAFCDAFNELKNEPEYEALFSDLSPENVSGAYFAETTSGKIKTRESSIRDDVESYELIMQDKEELLSFDEPTQFIFSHSALQEGWDNPNVFQICTLNNTVSQVKKRQEIGRGVRLPVKQDGTRLDQGDDRNVLTVIANQSYADYAAALQEEYEDEGYTDDISKTTKNRRERTTATPKETVIDESEHFEKLWSQISPQTRYQTAINTDELVSDAAERLDTVQVTEARLRLDKAELDLGGDYEVSSRVRRNTVERLDREVTVPDVVGEIADDTKLTRNTVARILDEADVFEAISKNPHAFMSEAKSEIGELKAKHVVEGVEYEKTDEQYAKDIISEIRTYADNTVSVDNSVYDKIVYDSDGERRFATRIDTDESVILFLKLPSEYTIPTPYGDYNPDWAIAYQHTNWDSDDEENPPELYLVRETKFADPDDLRPREKQKIRCAREHYDALEVNFKDIYEFEDDDPIQDILGIEAAN
ncbi:DEAD/DEAH box helicase family protein [Halobacteriaceae archaeon GCM10025711]